MNIHIKCELIVEEKLLMSWYLLLLSQSQVRYIVSLKNIVRISFLIINWFQCLHSMEIRLKTADLLDPFESEIHNN